MFATRSRYLCGRYPQSVVRPKQKTFIRIAMDSLSMEALVFYGNLIQP